jgi:phenylalanyl-tRNA synthetase beta chain
MNVSLRWLEEFVDLPTDDPAELESVLSNLGLEVDGIEVVEAGFTGVVVTRVLEVKPHPNADKLRLVRVDRGDGEQEVVCGAWNFEAGAIVPLATVGAVLAGGLEVGEREIRGITSLGMICSEAELGLGEDAGGILVLEEDLFEVGADFATALPYPDVVFDLSITPNRSDAMSIYGVARDLAAYYDLPLRTPEHPVAAAKAKTRVKVAIEAPDLCPRFTVREIRNVGHGPSPLWMRLRLRDAGMRPISAVVDVTNYVMLEYGQPIHAFDADLVPEESFVIRRARAGERLVTLDGFTRDLLPDDLLVSGPDAALALAGVMGGEASEVTGVTDRILLEVAHFTAPGVLLTGKRLGLRSEAGARFERGVDPELPPLVSARAASLMAELAGGEVLGGFVDVYPEPIAPAEVALPIGEAERLLGVAIDAGTITTLLTRLGFAVSGDDPLHVVVPTYRPDVTRPADLVEEIGRLYGFDNIPRRLPKGVGEGLPVWEQRRRLVRRTLVGAGYHEIMTYSFLGADAIAALGFPEDDPEASPVPVRNPLSEEEGFLRTTLLPGVLGALRANAGRGRADAAVFEIGRVFLTGGADLPLQPRHVAFAATGRAPGPLWEGGAAVRDARDAVGLWETLAAALGVEYELEQAADAPFHPGRCGRIVRDGQVVGRVGELHPGAAAAFDLDGRVAVGELDLEPLLGAPEAWTFTTPSAFPPVVFDLAFELDAAVPAAALVAAVEDGADPRLENLELFDLFSGPPLEAGRKSIAVRLTFRDAGRTLTDDDLVPVREAIVAAVAAACSGTLRGG